MSEVQELQRSDTNEIYFLNGIIWINFFESVKQVGKNDRIAEAAINKNAY
ncbi:hypothetical protein [Pantoea sp. AS142]